MSSLSANLYLSRDCTCAEFFPPNCYLIFSRHLLLANCSVASSRPIEGDVRALPHAAGALCSGDLHTRKGQRLRTEVGRAFWPGREALSALQKGWWDTGSAVRPAVVRFDRNPLKIGRWPTGWRWRCDVWGVLGRAGSVIQQTLERAGLRRALAGSPTQPAGLVGAMTTSGVGRGLAQAIRGRVFLPGQPGFGSAAHVFNTRFDGIIPLAVARPVDATAALPGREVNLKRLLGTCAMRCGSWCRMASGCAPGQVATATPAIRRCLTAWCSTCAG